MIKWVLFSGYISPHQIFWDGWVWFPYKITHPFLLARECAVVVISDPATKIFGGWGCVVSLLNHTPPFFGWRVCYSCYIRTCHKKIGRWGGVVLLLNHTPPSKILKRVYFSCYISPPPNFLRWGCVVSLLNHTPPPFCWLESVL